MDSDSFEDILYHLLNDLSESFNNKKAKHAVQDAQKAYMTAARKFYDLRCKNNTAPLFGS